MDRKPKRIAADAVGGRRLNRATVAPPANADVEGQGHLFPVVQVLCPCNGDLVTIVIYDDGPPWYQCDVCGCIFEY